MMPPKTTPQPEQSQDAVKCLYVTEYEAQLIMDSFKVTNPISKSLALKSAALVMEFEGVRAQQEAVRLLTIAKANRAADHLSAFPDGPSA